MSRAMKKPAFCICENKDADQRLCFRYKDSTIPLLPKSEISSLYPSSVAVQPGLCRKPRRPIFSERGPYYQYPSNPTLIVAKPKFTSLRISVHDFFVFVLFMLLKKTVAVLSISSENKILKHLFIFFYLKIVNL